MAPPAIGASVVHQFAKGGVYTVTLKVTDRGGYSSSVSQQVTVLGSGGTTTAEHRSDEEVEAERAARAHPARLQEHPALRYRDADHLQRAGRRADQDLDLQA